MYNNITEALTKHQCDKNFIIPVIGGHKYGPAYDLVMNTLYNKLQRPLKLLEIGVFEGRSLLAWQELDIVGSIIGVDNCYLRDVHQFGLEFNDKVELMVDPQYNAYDKNFIQFLKENRGTFDIIIDDGPHTWWSQEFFLKNYDELLNPGGVLFCEDIHQNHMYDLVNLKDELDLFILDLRANSNINGDEIVALKYKN